MKKLFLILMLVFVLFSNSFSYEIAFIVNASGRADLLSKFPNEFQYFEKLKNRYINVSIIPESEIIVNSQIWRDALSKYDVFFISVINNSTFEKVWNNITNENSKFHGIFIKLDLNKSNFFIIDNKVNISTNNHPITRNYQPGIYNLNTQDTIFHFSPSNSKCLVFVSNNNCTLAYYNVLYQRVVFFGINTSELGILDDLLFNSIDWLLNFSDYGIKLFSKKDEYLLKENMEFFVNSSENISSLNVKGILYYPNNNREFLIFSNVNDFSKSASFPTFPDDIPGLYRVEAFVEGRFSNLLKSSINVTLAEFAVRDFVYKIENYSLKVNFSTYNFDGEYSLPNANITINYPNQTNITYYINKENNKFYFVLTIDPKDYGNYTAKISVYTSKFLKNLYFNFSISPIKSIELSNYNVSIFVDKNRINYTEIKIRNTGTATLKLDFIPLLPWISFVKPENNTIEPGKEISLRIIVNFTGDYKESEYSGVLKIKYDDNETLLNIKAFLKLEGVLSLVTREPTFEIAEGREKDFYVIVKNIGEGSLIIKDVQIEDLNDIIRPIVKTEELKPGNETYIYFSPSLREYQFSDLFEEREGNITIYYDEDKNLTFSMRITIYKNIVDLVSSISDEVNKIKNDLDSILSSTQIDLNQYYQRIDEIKANIQMAGDLFNRGDFKTSANLYNSIISSVKDLSSSVNSLKSQLYKQKPVIEEGTQANESKSNIFIFVVITVFVVVIIVVIFAFLGRREAPIKI